jgi:chromosome segregation protein
VNNIRTKESDKSLAQQRLQYLKEKETSLNDFLSKAGGQSVGLEESIQFSEKQIVDEEAALVALQASIDQIKLSVEENRKAFDDKRGLVDELRRKNQSLQRNQFESEKNVAIRDTSLMNLEKSIQHINEEQKQRATQLTDLTAQRDQNNAALE